MINYKYSFPAVSYKLGLYPIVSSLSWLVRMLEANIKTIQLRIKNCNETQIKTDIETAILLARDYNAQLFINDYWRIAIHYGAYGVHLGQEDINITNIKAISNSGLRLGVSSYNETELMRALSLCPSYVSLGYIFNTETKNMNFYKPQGLDYLNRMVIQSKDIPTVAIGGISLDRIQSVLASGVDGISIISAITHSLNWRQTIKDLNSIIN